MTSKIVLAASMDAALNLQYSFGMKRGSSTGWPTVDELFTVAPGQLTVVTGWPGSGKSEWLDALCVNLVKRDWRALYYSPENWPISLHLSKLAEKWLGKPFGPGPTSRMEWVEAQRTIAEIGDRVAFIHPEKNDGIGVSEVIDRASEFFMTTDDDRKRLLVIDPWNEVGHIRPGDISETDFISQALSYIRNWAREQAVHVFVVAHPAKQRREEGKLPVPSMDMIAGSQHWWNKADNGITVWRDYGDPGAPVKVYVQKVRFKHIGRIGSVDLNYDRPTGRYFEPQRDSNGRTVVYSHGAA